MSVIEYDTKNKKVTFTENQSIEDYNKEIELIKQDGFKIKEDTLNENKGKDLIIQITFMIFLPLIIVGYFINKLRKIDKILNNLNKFFSKNQ